MSLIQSASLHSCNIPVLLDRGIEQSRTIVVIVGLSKKKFEPY